MSRLFVDSGEYRTVSPTFVNFILSCTRRNRFIIIGDRRSLFDRIKGPIHDYSPDGEMLPPNRDVMVALQEWDGKRCLVANMAPQPAGRVLNTSDQTLHGARIEMKA